MNTFNGFNSLNVFITNYCRLLSETLHHEYNLKQLHNVLKIWNALKDTYYFSESPFKYLIDNWAIIKTRYISTYI